MHLSLLIYGFDNAVPSWWDDAAGSTLHAGSTSTADDTAAADGCTVLPSVCTAAILSTSTAASDAQPAGGEFRTAHAAK